MSNTLSTLSSAGITLTVTGAYYSPFTITPSGTISTADSFGVYSAITAPTVVNMGFIGAAVGGVEFEQRGAVVNDGTILSTGGGVFSGAGVYLQSGGYIANSGASALISGNIGVASEGQAGTVSNAGTITGNTGVFIASGGLVANIGSSALISGADDGATLYGPTATIVNQGTITATAFYGVKSGASGSASITNSGASALIFGGSDGIVVKFASSATVANDGTIVGVNYVGVYSSVGGAVTNTGTSAVISGASGISLTDASGTVVNRGAITGTGDDGAFLGAGGSINNDGTASTISGESFGVVIETAAGSVVNDGTIAGTLNDALYLGDGGSVTNSGTSALISGGRTGVQISNAYAVVLNEGSILASGEEGIALVADGRVINAGTSALIAGGTSGSGIILDGSAGYVGNAGTILGGSSDAYGYDGVGVYENGTIFNTGSIIGGSGSVAGAGVYLYALSTLNNQGTIIGGSGTSYGNGVRVKYDNDVINGAATDPSALILGNHGVFIQGNSTLNNYATIAGRMIGVFLQQTISALASITNEATGTITGATSGVYLEYSASIASTGLFTNAGQISGEVDGVVETGLGGTILNTGTIIARDPSRPYAAEGIAIGGSADIINGSSAAANALILGYNGVVIGGGSSLINYGTIGANEMGLQIRQTGSLSAGVINEASGTIIGDYYGVDLNSGYIYSPGLFTNAGEIIGKYCAFNESGLGGTILNTGTIAGLGAGPSGISNAIIIGGGADIFNGSSNATGALISGTGFGAGILMSNQSGATGASVGTVTNYGTVLGGVHLPAGTVINTGMSALIAGGAVEAYSQLFKGDGVYGLQNSTVINTGVIQGGLGTIANDGNGVYLGSQGSLNNQGTIFGGNDDTLGSGVLVKSGDIITNGAATDSSAMIFGYDGVEIQGSSSVDNAGTIAGSNAGIYIQQTLSAPAIVINQASGTLTGLQGGVYLKAVDSVTNTGLILNAGQISGDLDGIYEHGVGGTILNTGTITVLGFGTPAFGDGIFITGGAEVVNGSSTDAGAVIGGLGIGFGIDMSSGAFGPTIASVGTVINYGTVHGGSQEGVQLAAGTVVNGTALDNLALITGIGINGNALVENFGTVSANGEVAPALRAFGAGIILNGAANDTAALIESTGVTNVSLGRNSSLTNYGTIQGGSIDGIYSQSGVISNAATGVIIGGRFAANVAGYGAQTVINAGVIEGTIALNAVAQYAYNDVFSNSGTIASLLGSAGTAIEFSKGNDLLIDDPAGVFIGTVSGGSGSNTIELASGGLGTLAGIGTQFTQFGNINLDPGAAWQLEGDSAGLTNGVIINGFAQPDAIILDGFTEASYAYVPGTGLELTGSDASTAIIDITGDFSTTSFLVQNIAAGTEIQLCYLRGTRIATPAGEVPIEELRIGDAVITKFGGCRRIKWIGRQSYARRFIEHNFDRIPVKFSAGCWGEGLPKRDLWVSPGHSMLVFGVLVLAKSLVNGITIMQDECPAQVDYFQLEFEAHDCVLAEGVWSEAYADGPGLRAQFHNAAEFYALYPAHEAPSAFSLCAARPLAGPGLAAALRPILAKLKFNPGPLHGYIDEISPAGIIEGWAWDSANPHLPVALEILAGGRRIGHVLACEERDDLRRAGLGRGHCSFRFAAPPGLLRNRHVRVRRVQDGRDIVMAEARKSA